MRSAWEDRGAIVDAGKRRVSEAVAAGRSAYRETASETAIPDEPSVQAAGMLLFEAAAVLAALTLTTGLRKHIRGIAPKLEALLDSSRELVEEGTNHVTAIASKAHRVLDRIESATRPRSTV